MSKSTQPTNPFAPLLLGGLILAAGVIAGIKLARRHRFVESAESAIANCEHALAALVDRSSTVAA